MCSSSLVYSRSLCPSFLGTIPHLQSDKLSGWVKNGSSQSASSNMLDNEVELTLIDFDRVHISDQPITLQNWYRHINWFSTTLVVLIPTYGLYACRYVPLTRATAVWAVIYYFFTGFGITGGYHRLWSHRCYNARLPLRLFLAFVGAGAIQGSIRFWSSKHRAHHRWTDTQKDPYCALKGFFHSHIGWMVLQQDPKKMGRTDISDLDADPVVVWQHKHCKFDLISRTHHALTDIS
jgi:fatty-acid desaturase